MRPFRAPFQMHMRSTPEEVISLETDTTPRGVSALRSFDIPSLSLTVSISIIIPKKPLLDQSESFESTP